LIVSAATAALAACGGGGDSGDRASPSSASVPAAPKPPTNTGLSTPTLTITQSLGAVIPLVEEMVKTYAIANEAQAAKALGSMVPGLGSAAASPYNCSSGQITFTADTGGNLAYAYNNCSDGTYTFNGTSQVTPSFGAGGAVTSYRLAFSDLQLGGPSGLAATVSGSITCTPASTAGQAPSCTSALGGYVWGSDISYAIDGAANGSHQCDCGQGTWNVTFKGFASTSGAADVFATNGSAVVTRTGPKTFTVVVYVGDTVQTYTVTLP
jgi:hypothetical protein